MPPYFCGLVLMLSSVLGVHGEERKVYLDMCNRHEEGFDTPSSPPCKGGTQSLIGTCSGTPRKLDGVSSRHAIRPTTKSLG